MLKDIAMMKIDALMSGAMTCQDLILTARMDSIPPFQNRASSVRPFKGSVHPMAVARTGAERFGSTLAPASPPSPATASNVTSLDSIQTVTAASTTSADASAGTNVVSETANGGRTSAMNGQRRTCGQPPDVTRG